jgi:hypothetical protein
LEFTQWNQIIIGLISARVGATSFVSAWDWPFEADTEQIFMTDQIPNPTAQTANK